MKNAALDPKDTYPGGYICVTALNAGAGLESPIIFLAGLRRLYRGGQSLRLSDEERDVLFRNNTSKLYMAVTGTGRRVNVLSQNNRTVRKESDHFLPDLITINH